MPSHAAARDTDYSICSRPGTRVLIRYSDVDAVTDRLHASASSQQKFAAYSGTRITPRHFAAVRPHPVDPAEVELGRPRAPVELVAPVGRG